MFDGDVHLSSHSLQSGLTNRGSSSSYTCVSEGSLTGQTVCLSVCLPGSHLDNLQTLSWRMWCLNLQTDCHNLIFALWLAVQADRLSLSLSLSLFVCFRCVRQAEQSVSLFCLPGGNRKWELSFSVYTACCSVCVCVFKSCVYSLM